MRGWVWLSLYLVGCGRVGFDPSSTASGTGSDAGGAVLSDDAAPAPASGMPGLGIDPAWLTDGLFPTTLDPGDLAEVDTDTGLIMVNGSEVFRGPGFGVIGEVRFEHVGNLGVFVTASADYATASELRVSGSRGLAMIFVDHAALDGTIDVSAMTCADTYGCGVAGGGDGGQDGASAQGCASGGQGAASGSTGGGGGALAQPGGNGGNEISGSDGGSGGAMDDCPFDPFKTLLGGSGGGRGGNGGGGGGGGGIVYIYAGDILGGAGRILANGSGGRGSGDGGGGGGGSGGTILLQARSIELAGVLAANGGAGGEGDGSGNGQGGTSSATPATCPSTGGNRGGAGGSAMSPAAAGTASTNNTGGGGGSVGHIHLHAEDLDISAAIVSPPPSTSSP